MWARSTGGVKTRGEGYSTAGGESDSELKESGEETSSGGGSRANESGRSGARYWGSSMVNGGVAGEPPIG